MKTRWLIPVGLLAVIVVSGCANTPLCTPDYVQASQLSFVNTGDQCKTACYTQYQTTSYTFQANTTLYPSGLGIGTCRCDVNKCGSQITEPAATTPTNSSQNIGSSQPSANNVGTNPSVVAACTEAKVLLQKAEYNPDTKALNLTIYNYGRTDLRFQVLLSYPNAAAQPAGTGIDVSAGKLTSYVVADVENNLDRVTVQSTACNQPCVECPGAQDYLRHADIKGLGY